MSLLQDLTRITTLNPSIECFIIGKHAMALLEKDVEALTLGATLDKKEPWAKINGVPVIQSTKSQPFAVETLFRNLDGELCIAIMLSPDAFEDMIKDKLSEAGLGG